MQSTFCEICDYYKLKFWILHLKEKMWISNDDLVDFLTAVDDLGDDLRGKERFNLDVQNMKVKLPWQLVLQRMMKQG